MRNNQLLSINSFRFWRHLINLWSILFWFLIVYDFISQNLSPGTLNVVSMIYIGILAIYVSNKEFERWYCKHEGQHPGEVFVIIWSALILVLLILDFASGGAYRLPDAVVSSYIAVLTILVVTRKSRQVYLTRRQKSKK